MNRAQKRLGAALCCAALALSVFTGCAASNSASYSSTAAYAPDTMANESGATVSEEALATGEGAGATLPETTNRKIIRTVDLTLETLDYDASTQAISQAVEAVGGYVESSTVTGGGIGNHERSRTASMTLRIPQQELDGFLGQVSEVATVLRRTDNAEDVTLSYVDVQSRKNALEVEQERLLELLGQAEELEGIIQLEQRLSEVRYQLESLTSQLRAIDSQVQYSTVTLQLREVVQISDTRDDSLLDRMGSGLQRSLRNLTILGQNLLVGLVVSLPYLAIVGVLVLVVLLIVRGCIRRSRKRRAQQPPVSPPPVQPAEPPAPPADLPPQP